MKKLSINEIKEINLKNEYQKNVVLEALNIHDTISKYYPVETVFTVSEFGDNEFFLEYYEHFLVNDVCKIKIIYNKYKKHYSISLNENFKNLSIYDINMHENIFNNEFKKPNNIGVLSTKKIERWVEYIQNLYNYLKKKDEEFENKINLFLEKIKNENIIWNDENKTSGKIIKNGICYSFEIINGSIIEKIEIDYKLKASLELFKMLSDNKYGDII